MGYIVDCKDRALSALSNNWGDACVCAFLFLIFNSIISGFTCALAAFLVLPFLYSFQVEMLRRVRGEKIDAQRFLLSGWTTRVFLTLLLKYVYTLLWSLLLIIPGIIKHYSYAMTEYLLYDNPKLENNAAIEASMAIMEGHKMELFILDLSFIGWYLIAWIPCGLGYIPLAAYHFSARAAFYERLLDQMGIGGEEMPPAMPTADADDNSRYIPQ